MNVYPNNFLEVALMKSTFPLLVNSSLSIIHNNFFNQTVKWEGDTGEIQFDWDESTMTVDSILIGNGNSQSAEIKLTLADGSVIEHVLYLEDEITIYNFPSPLAVLSGSIKFNSGQLITEIGYVALSNKIELPRFVVFPKRKRLIQSAANRTLGGNAYGLYTESLTGWDVNYTRLTDDEYKTIDAYILRVLNVVPHVIDLYPEAHEHYPPIFATLAEGYESEKRDEDGFYWNMSLSWKEAK
jgi:hypothetical protein